MTDTGQGRVLVIVVGYNSEEWLSPCLSSLSQASRNRLQLCFVDNLNNPGFHSMDLSAFDVEVLQTDEPLGFAAANNMAIQRSEFESDFTVFLNQDTVSCPGWIDSCAECFHGRPDLGIVSPGLRTYDLADWEPNLLSCLRESSRSLDDGSHEVVELRSVTAAAMMIRTDVLRRVGPFDPLFGSYYEDNDLCRRVRNAGYRIAVCPDARVGHFSGSVTSTPEAEVRRSRLLIRNRLIHAVRESPDRRLRVLARACFYTLPVNLVRGLLRTESSQPVSAVLGAHWDLLKVADRLISRRRDETCWQQFLREFDVKTTAGTIS